ncbi:MAG: MBL fold metallo-hydrolase [Peptostreptococcaceae bacterium]|nr:MBL fold metallo-hydrolase [Peptostreptococcaceae bacterium]
MRRHVKSNVSWLGFIDWELTQFHGDDYSVFNGSSQNAYLIEEEKTVLIDTVWKPHDQYFVENLKKEIDLKKIDYIIVNHGEIDHSGALPSLMKEIPDTPIYCTKNAVNSLKGQFHQDWNFNVVKTGDTLDIGNGKQLIFVEMKMLHWPDSMATYLTGDNILFSNDAFGQHFAVQELFNDKADKCLLDKEAMKYYANILNPFSPLVKRKLEEIISFNLPIDIIAPSHGVIWRDNPLQIVEKYSQWCNDYQENQITIVYDTMWEATASMAHLLGEYLHEFSPDTVVKIYNCAKEDKNEIMTEVFKSKAIAVGSPTVGKDILSSVAGWLHFLKSLEFKKKKAAAFGTYGWSGEAPKVIQKSLADAGFETIETFANVNWTMKDDDREQIKKIAEELVKACG